MSRNISGGFKPSTVSLGGATKRELTRDELLAQASAERESRAQIKARTRAATRIQVLWRGHFTRVREASSLVAAWKDKHARLAANPALQVTAASISGDILPTLFLALYPTFPPARTALQQGARPLDLSQPSAAAALKGTLAIIMRSITQPELANNFCGAACGTDAQPQRTWLHQASRLCTLCASALASSPSAPDALLDAACIRAMELCTDSNLWKCHTSSAAAAGAGALLLQRLAAASGAFYAAAGRMAAASSPLLPRLLSIILKMLSSMQQGSADDASIAGQASGMWQQLCLRVWTIPGLYAQLSSANRAVLQQQQVLQQLLHCLQRAAQEGRPAGLQAMWALANTVQLLLAEAKPLTPQLSDPSTAAALSSAAIQLLIASSSSKSSASSSQQGTVGWTMALNTAGPLADQAMLLQLLSALGQHHMPLFACLCVQLVHTLPDVCKLHSSSGSIGTAASSKAAAPSSSSKAAKPPQQQQPVLLVPSALNALAFSPQILPSLWRWLCHDLGLPLEAPYEASRGLDVASLTGGCSALLPHHTVAMGLFCRCLGHLLLVLDDHDFHDRQEPLGLAQSRAIVTCLNTLVFHTHFPKPGSAAAGGGTAAQQAVDGPTLQVARALLSEQAPLVLRALYDRDVRRAYCKPALWLAPYNAMMQSGGLHSSGSADMQAAGATAGAAGQGSPQQRAARPAAAAAIMDFLPATIAQALLNATDGGSSGGTPQQGALMQARASRPTAVAALLRAAPQCIPFQERVEFFRALIEADKARGGWSLPVAEGGVPPIKATIRRDLLLEDSFSQLYRKGTGLRARLFITFVSGQGLQEAGLDHGGLMKELLEEVAQAGLDQDRGLFRATPEGLAYPNPAAEMVDSGLPLLEFLGLAVAKALYEGLLLDLAFAPLVAARLQGRQPLLDDLATLDAELHRSIMQVKRYTGDVSELCLDFTVEDSLLGRTLTQELLPGRGSTPVTNDNRLLYCHLLADWHLNLRLGRPVDAFVSGLTQIIPSAWLRLFNVHELNQMLTGGEGGDIEVEDLQAHAQYSGGYSASSPAVKLFWKVVGGMSAAEKGRLMKFVTSCSRAPLGGFKYLQPPFTVHLVDCDASLLALVGGKDVDRLPSASTCYNMLKLPNYRRGSTMREKLLYAINANAGFELS